jgi:hypothetical protein
MITIMVANLMTITLQRNTDLKHALDLRHDSET